MLIDSPMGACFSGNQCRCSESAVMRRCAALTDVLLFSPLSVPLAVIQTAMMSPGFILKVDTVAIMR